jgi:hypothetical protein
MKFIDVMMYLSTKFSIPGLISYQYQTKPQYKFHMAAKYYSLK